MGERYRAKFTAEIYNFRRNPQSQKEREGRLQERKFFEEGLPEWLTLYPKLPKPTPPSVTLRPTPKAPYRPLIPHPEPYITITLILLKLEEAPT